MEQPLLFNRMPGFDTAAGSKRSQAKIFHRLTDYNPNVFNFVPRSFLLPKDRDALEAYMAKPNKTFICKPREGCQGAGIVMVKNFKDLPSFVVNSSDYVV